MSPVFNSKQTIYMPVCCCCCTFITFASVIISEILQHETLPDSKHIIEEIIGFDWKIETKYYTADTLLCIAEKRTIGDQAFAERVQAFVVNFDADQVKSVPSNSSSTQHQLLEQLTIIIFEV